MKSLAGTTVIYDSETSTGLILRGYKTDAGAPIATASVYAVGAKILGTSDGIPWVNAGTTLLPVWESEQMSITVSMTAAQIISNYTTSLLAIPAYAGKAIILDSAEFDLTGTATQFTGGGVMNLQYDSTANGAGTTLHADIAASVITGATARVITRRIPKDLSAIATASITSLPVYIGTKTAVFAAGTGTAVWKIKYHLV